MVESCSPLIGPQLAGLITLLTEPGPFTVFAPTNAAFEAVAPVKLQAVLADPVLLRCLKRTEVLESEMTM